MHRLEIQIEIIARFGLESYLMKRTSNRFALELKRCEAPIRLMGSLDDYPSCISTCGNESSLLLWALTVIPGKYVPSVEGTCPAWKVYAVPRRKISFLEGISPCWKTCSLPEGYLLCLETICIVNIYTPSGSACEPPIPMFTEELQKLKNLRI
jgi:hypothetical protein